MAAPQLDTITPGLRRLGKQEALLLEREGDGRSVTQRTHRSTDPHRTEGGLRKVHRAKRLHIGFVRGLVTKFILNLIDLIAG